MLITEVHHRPTLVSRHAEIIDNRVYLRRKVITFLVQFLRTLLGGGGGGFNAKSIGFRGSVPGPSGGAYSAPRDPLVGLLTNRIESNFEEIEFHRIESRIRFGN